MLFAPLFSLQGMISLLVGYGADTTLVDVEGLTMEMIAAVKGPGNVATYKNAIQPRIVALIRAKAKATMLQEFASIPITDGGRYSNILHDALFFLISSVALVIFVAPTCFNALECRALYMLSSSYFHQASYWLQQHQFVV